MRRPGAEALVGGLQNEKLFPNLNLFLVQQRRSLTDGMSFVWRVAQPCTWETTETTFFFIKKYFTESNATEEKTYQ